MWGAMPAQAEIFRVADMVRPIVISHAQCAATSNTVWVTAYGESACIRYYLSNVGGAGPNPVVYMSGDKLGVYKRSTDTFEQAATYKDVDSKNLQAVADRYSRAAGMTGIYLARVGLDGSSGYHGVRHTLLELKLMNAALDAIKWRYRFTGFNLVGQSGGSRLIGGLLVLRTDILCAVPGSGALAEPAGKRGHNQPLDSYTAIEYVETIARQRSARIIVISDRLDQKVPIEKQTSFVTAMLKSGGHAEQFFVNATDENHHGVTAYTVPAVAGCIYGASYAQIDVALRDVASQLAAKQKQATR
jgi:hypothetical protein